MSETRIERRIFYRYGVNSGWYSGRWPEVKSHDSIQKELEDEVMGPVKVERRESRTVEYGDWEATDE